MSQPSRKSRAVLVAVTLIITFLAVLGIWLEKSGTRSPEGGAVRRITIAQVGDFFLYAPLYVAIDGGFFRNQGLDVSIVNTGGDDKTWAAVLSGSAAFGVADPTFVAVSAARGQNGVVVASLVNGVPFWGITYEDIAPFKNAKGLAQYSVATFPSPSTAYALQKKMFTDAGLIPQIREGAFGAIIPMLKAGKADIGLELEPNVSQAVSDGAKIVYSLAELYGDFAITGVTSTELTVQKDPALVRSVNVALQGALDLLHAEPDRALTFLAKRFPGVSSIVAKAALERVLRDGVIPRSTTISEEAWNKAIRLRTEVGDLKEAAPYNRFVWIANPATK
jgi:NitT/TauT family transport system substrate-binding protein